MRETTCTILPRRWETQQQRACRFLCRRWFAPELANYLSFLSGLDVGCVIREWQSHLLGIEYR